MSLLKNFLVWLLFLESRLILAKYKPFIIAVTGSVGKTSTKDAIFCVLKSYPVCTDKKICFVRKSEKSLNSEIGLPLTIIGVPNAWHSFSGWLSNIWAGFKLIIKKSDYPDCLVLEVGADHPGDIEKAAKLLRPDIAVITRVSRTPVHVEFFSSPEEVLAEKMKLAAGVKQSGTIVLYADDDNTGLFKDSFLQKGYKVITYGLSEKADVRGVEEAITYEGEHATPVGYSFKIIQGNETAEVTVKKGLGTPYMYSFIAAAAVGKACEVNTDVIAEALNNFKVTPGRLNVLPGLHRSTLIDDTYNSSPDAVISALDCLKKIETTGVKYAVLGDMMELGNYSTETHREIGKEVASRRLHLITVGPRSHATADEAIGSGLPASQVHMCNSAEEAAEYLLPLIKPHDIILIKGSQSMRMERAAKRLMLEPEKAGEFLVRQEREWLLKK